MTDRFPTRRRTARRAPLQVGLALLASFAGGEAGAAEIRVLTSGAFKPVVTALVPGFEKATGHRVSLDNDTAGGLAKRVAGGEAFDLLILTPGGLADLAGTGRVAAEAPVALARVSIGVAVKDGAPQPDISTPDAFRTAVLAARKVAVIDPAAGGSSGIYLARLFERMGIAEAVRAKAVLVPGGLVATRVVSGEADLAIHQISEIVAVKGATLVGPLPAEIQNDTVYAGALSSAPREPAAARAFLAELSGATAAGVLAEKGMRPAAP